MGNVENSPEPASLKGEPIRQAPAAAPLLVSNLG
jgi:hypothetical protein